MNKIFEPNRGFTLLEVLISVIILGIVTTALLPRYAQFAQAVNLRRNAQEVALAIREAQAYAFAVRGFDHDNNPGTPLLFNAWGINFDKSASLTQYSLFVDLYPATPNKQYDAGQSELVRTIPIANGVKIKSLCKGMKTSGLNCDLNRLDIVYQRPNPDTTLKGDGVSYQDLEIILESPRGDTRTVVVWQSGQISVE